MNISQLHQKFLQSSGIATDSRNITDNCIFFALKGAHFNGNIFAAEALKKGAMYAVVDEAEFAGADNTILVEDVLRSLQDLALYHRNHCKAKVIALTGSNGKTTTKELIHAVLAKKYRTIATKGNLNNHIGVPLTLLSIKNDTEMAIVEMGANHRGEIAFLCSLARPDYGYITNFGKAHLEGFGGVAGVIEGKSELYAFLIKNGKHIFFNADDPIQHERIGHYHAKSGYSSGQDTFFRVRLLEASPFVKMECLGVTINTMLVGSYNYNNCAAAALLGNYFGLTGTEIKGALESYRPENNRSQLLEKNGYHILLDAYNANPSSMKAALENFELMPVSPKTVFLGDMFELGESTRHEHSQVAKLAAEKGFDTVYLIGENFSGVETPLKTFSNFGEFETYLREHKPRPGSILIKGSRGMALERILDSL